MMNYLKITIWILLSSLLCTSITNAQNASFTSSQSNGCSPLIVFFDGSSSSGTAPLTYHWDFGNGNQTVTQDDSPGASYLAPGTYTVTLRVEDSNGNMSSPTTRNITVFEGPDVDFSVDGVNEGCSPLTVTFTDLTIEGSAAIEEYFWAFGDGTSSTDQNPIKTYTQEGVYEVKLIVKDVNGCQNDFSIPNAVTVVRPPQPDFDANITSTCENNLNVQFTNNSLLSSQAG
ncbi:MAG: PKD domain-containing protein, partial [Bacteroidota bacterium]